MKRFGIAASLAAVLLGTSSPLAYGGPAYANAAAVAQPWQGAQPSGGLKDLIKKGLVNLAVAFTNAGAAIVTNRMIQAGTAPKYIGWGTGTTAAAVTDTALVTEVAPTTGGGRVTGTESRTTITVTNDNYQVTGTVTSATAGARAITEAMLADAVSAGNCLMRAVFSAVNVDNGDSIAFTFGLKFVPNVV